MPPGWYPDPWQGGRQQRYWDGNQWGSMTAPNRQAYPPPAGPPVAAAHLAAPQSPPPLRPRRFLRLFTWSMAGFMLAVVLTAYALSRGQEIKRVSPTGDIEFYSSGGGTEFNSEEIQQRQTSMDERLSELEQRARETGGSEEPPPDVIDLTGTWFGANGLRYQIEQYGTEAVIQEISDFGVTATGYGEVDEFGARFEYLAIDGSTGVAELELVSERELRGTFTNDAFGTSAQAVLLR